MSNGVTPTTNVPSSELVTVSITCTVLPSPAPPQSDTYKRAPSGLTVAASGDQPIGSVAVTVLVAVSITATRLMFGSVTYTRALSGVTTTLEANGTGMEATTVRVARSMTETPPVVLAA